MNKELALILSLRKVLAEVGAGRGVANSVVTVCATGQGPVKDFARRILLGYPPARSAAILRDSESAEVRLLTELIAQASNGDVVLASRKGESVSKRMEEWVKARAQFRNERRILALRGMLVSGVLGAVMGMLSSVATLFSITSLTQPEVPTDLFPLRVAAAAMSIISSGMLGLYVSGRRFPLYCAVSLGAFCAVTLSVGPLTSFGSDWGWAIK